MISVNMIYFAFFWYLEKFMTSYDVMSVMGVAPYLELFHIPCTLLWPSFTLLTKIPEKNTKRLKQSKAILSLERSKELAALRKKHDRI